MRHPNALAALAAYRESVVLASLIETGIAESLLDTKLRLSVIVKSGHLSEPATLAVLAAGISLGIVEKVGSTYTLSAAWRTAVRPLAKGQALKSYASYHLDYVKLWSNLPTLVRSGRAPTPTFEELDETGSRSLTSFSNAVHSSHVDAARYFARNIDLSRHYHVVDGGSGSGTYSLALLDRYRNLRATLIDFSRVLESAAELARTQGVSHRVTLYPGSLLQAELPEDMDVALFSNVLHLFPRRTTTSLLRRVKRSLVESGIVIINEALLSDDRCSPRSTTLFNLTVMLRSGGRGGLFNQSDLQKIADSAGFSIDHSFKTPVHLDPYGRPYSTLILRRK